MRLRSEKIQFPVGLTIYRPIFLVQSHKSFCFIQDEICSEIEPEDWDYCSSLTLDNCSSNNISVCDESCKWVQCNFVSSTGSNNFSMCVPDDLPASNQTNDICMTNIGFFIVNLSKFLILH